MEREIKEFSCGAVLFTETGGIRRYVLVVERSGACGFPKGHMEARENEYMTASREVREEVGAEHLRWMPGFRERITYPIAAGRDKQVTLFLCRCDADEIQCRDVAAVKILPYSEAMAELKHENLRQILVKAEKYLQEH